MFAFYVAPRNRFSLDRWRVINVLYYYLYLCDVISHIVYTLPVQ